MYLPEAETEKGVLRQGDIISNIHILGALNQRAIHYSSTLNNKEQYNSWTYPSAPKFMDAMVLSHSCEIDRENTIKVTSIILAPIRSIDGATEPSKRQQLIDSNYIDQDNPSPSFLKYFYLEPNPKLKFSDGAVVDFSKCFSYRKQCYNILLEKKIIQLLPDVVDKMSFKLALYFYRSQN